MTYDFRTMTKKDMFKAKLANKIIDFGHIPTWRLKAFKKFCTKHELIYQPDGYRYGAYRVRHEYKYAYTGCTVSHLPFGWAFILWHEIVGYKNLQGIHPPKNNYVYFSNIHVKHRGGSPNFDYVMYFDGIVF